MCLNAGDELLFYRIHRRCRTGLYWGSGESKTFIDIVENEAENSKAFTKMSCNRI